MSLQIKLPKLFYAAGEPVSGNVGLTLKKSRQFNYINITLYAYEHTEWQEDSEKLPPQQAQVEPLTHRRRRRVLLNKTTRLFPPMENVNTKNSKNLEKGEYHFPFEFVIPDNFPPTMSYKDGKVRIIYKLKAIAAPKWSLNISTVQNFRVGLLYAIDPSVPPRVVEGSKSYLISSALFKSKTAPKDAPVLIKAFLNREVGYSGDEVIAHIDIDNQSPKALSSIKVKLKQDVNFGPRKERNTVWKKEIKVNIKEETRWNGKVNVSIPKLDLMPSVTNGSLVTVKYCVAVHITAFAAKNLIVELPFIVSIFPPLVPANPVYAPPSAPATSPPTPSISTQASMYSYPAPPYEQPTQGAQYPVLPLEEQNGPSRPYTPPSQLKERRMTYTPSIVPPPPEWVSAPSLNAPEKPVVQDTVSLVELDDAIYAIQSCLGDLESSVYYAQLNELDEVADFPVDQTKLYDLSQSQLLQTSKILLGVATEFVSEILSAIKVDANQNNNNNLSMSNASSLATGVQKLVYESKHTAILIGDSQSQICLLTACKAVAITCQQMLLAAKNLRYQINDPELKEERFQTAKDLLNKACSATQDAIQHLISTLQAAMKDTILKLHSLNNANNLLQNFMISFVNPFFEVPATPFTSVQQEAAILSGTISSLITAYSVSQDSTISLLQKVAEGVISFLTAVRGCFESSSQNKYAIKDIIDAARYIASNASLFMETAVKRSGKVGEDHQAFNDVTSRLLSSVSSCASMVKPLEVMNEPVTPAPSSPINVVAQLEDSLKTVESSHTELKQLEPIQELKALNLNENRSNSNNSNEDKPDFFEIDSEDENAVPTEQGLTACSKAIAESASNLLKIAIVTEKERETTMSLLSPFIVNENDKDTASNPLYRSADSKKFMVAAASHVAESTQKLVHMIKTFEEERQKGNSMLELEPLEVCARNVASATAQLVATSATFASSKSRSKLSETAKEIAYYSSSLVNTAKALIMREEPNVELASNSNDQSNNTQAKKQMFEQQIKILKLEKELDKARNQLFHLRKKEYNEK